MMGLDINSIRKDFPILDIQVNGKPLVYLDNAATTQKPVQVTNRIIKYYQQENSNVHRGVHNLSQVATNEYEAARRNLASFIGAANDEEIIYTRGTTEAMNMLASIFGQELKEGDEIIVSAMEHHSNLVPWQELCKRRNAHLRIIHVTEAGELDLQSLRDQITNKTKLISVAHISNVLGTINPVKEIAEIARQHGVPLAIDGAQALAHIQVNVQDIDCDFYAGSSHKAYGPMGIGFLYGRKEWLEKLPPYHFGGEMVDQVGLQTSTYNVLPFKYEAGTPNVAGALGMDAALQYLSNLGLDAIRHYEDDLLEYATTSILKIKGTRIVGTASQKTAVLSFVINGIHPYDLATLLDQMGIAVRTGHHCAQPLVEAMGLPGTLRASFALYNTKEEVDQFIGALERAISILQ